MSYLVFARKWRPQDFDEIVGQDHITTTLKNAVRLNRVSQTYLFTGPRGVGKTSAARILAKALNCQKGPTPSPCNKCTNCLEVTNTNSLDVIEIDGASNRGIDEIRNLRENVKLSPVNGKYKIYIIDEVHQITEAAFNALLKTLEEPPAHVKFIFATTAPHKIPATILSRCQRFDFKRVPIPQIVEKLKQIAAAEKISADENVYFEIAKASDGSMRDAESILDQLNSFCEAKIKLADVTKVLGIIEEDALISLVDLVSKKDLSAVLHMIEDMVNDGRDLFQFLIRLMGHVRNLTVIKINKNMAGTIALSKDMLGRLAAQSDNFTLEDLIYFFYLLASTYESAKKTGLARFGLEFSLIKFTRKDKRIPINEILEKIKKIEASGPHCGPEDRNPPPADKYEVKPKPRLEAKPKPEPAADNNITVIAQGPASNADLLFPDVESAWPQIINILAKKKVSLASFLAEGEPLSLESGVIKIGMPGIHKFHKEMLEKADNKKIVEDIIGRVLGSPAKVEFILVDKLERKNNFTLNSDVDEKKDDDPLVNDAMDVFRGSVIKNRNG